MVQDDKGLYMSCHNFGGGHSKKRKIAIISGVGIAASGIAYVSVAANPVAAAAIPAVLAFAACPAMCAAMGGAMWLNRRISKRKNQAQIQQHVVNSKEEPLDVKTESIDSNQQIAYQHKRRKGKKTAVQNTSAISN